MKKAAQPDPEMVKFQAALLESIDQMQRGEFAAVHTPEQMEAKKRGRQIGYKKADPKEATTIRFSPDVIGPFKATGKGWQTRIDAALRDWLTTHTPDNVGT